MKGTSKPQSEESVNTDLCRVCNDKSAGAHFGIDSCRACAAFFRRSIALDKQYLCRKGGNNCKIDKAERSLCRKCRLRKCLDVGMPPECIQPKKEQLNDSESMRPTHQPTSPSETEILQRTPLVENIVHPVPLVLYTTTNKIHENNGESSQSPNLLHTILSNYRQLCSVRRTTEIAMSPGSFKRLFDAPTPPEGMQRLTCKKVSQTFRATLPAFSEFITSSFEEFGQFDQAEKWIVFRSFMSMIMAIEGRYRSFKYLPPEQCEKIHLLTMTGYMDLENLEEFMSDVTLSKFNVVNITRHVQKAFVIPSQQMIKIMRRIQLEEEEFAAVLALSAFCPQVDDSSPKIDEVSTNMREKIFDQLYMWYRSKNIVNYAARLGEVMCLYTLAMQCTMRLKEDLELFNLMEVFNEEPFFYDLMK